MKNYNKQTVSQFDANEFVNKQVQRAKNGSHVVTLRENGNVSPQQLAVAARKAGLVVNVDGLKVMMAVKKV